MKLRLAKASQLSWSWGLAWLSLAIIMMVTLTKYQNIKHFSNIFGLFFGNTFFPFLILIGSTWKRIMQRWMDGGTCQETLLIFELENYSFFKPVKMLPEINCGTYTTVNVRRQIKMESILLKSLEILQEPLHNWIFCLYCPG